MTQDRLSGDFRPGTIDANVLQGNEQVVLVVKKNASVLRRLTQWMENHAPPALPVLIIDDEADQASINTGGNRPPIEEAVDLDPDDVDDPARTQDELDPSRINGLVRALLASFRRVGFVAYTATPFANVLINHEAVDRVVFDDLYPRDFIVALPRPNGYTGAERLFGRESLPGEAEAAIQGLDAIDLVPDYEAEQLAPASRNLDAFVPQVPSSLRAAFLDFVLAIAARQHRTGQDGPATMLIHTHYRRAIHNQLTQAIRDHVSGLRQAWRYDRASIRPALRERWEQRFRPVIRQLNAARDHTFERIEEHIDRLFRDPLPVLVLNSDSDDELNYTAEPNLKAVVLGGNRLSRGLTLEGLLVSYYVRRTQYFDTLMQMGRWFGFRESYVDLTRIWTTQELAEWFRDLALAEEELRREIERYERENLTPLDFGPRIRCHPVMMITARNKMGSAQVIQQNYAGYLLQTIMFRLEDRAWLDGNLSAASRLIGSLGRPNYRPVGLDLPAWRGVPWEQIDAFLGEYNMDPRAMHEAGAIRQYLRAQTRQGELIEWYVSLRGRVAADRSLGDEPALAVQGQSAHRIGRTRLKHALHSIGSLINPAVRSAEPGGGDEEVGLTEPLLREAREEAARTGDFPMALRRRRDPREGLLLLYPISPFSRPKREEGTRLPLFEDPVRDGCTVVGVALVFPVSNNAATIEYAVGSVGPVSQDAT